MEVDAPQDVDIVVWQVVPQTAQLIVQLLIMVPSDFIKSGGS